MNLPPHKLSNEERKAQALASHEANEKVYSLVVKIISWRTGLQEGSVIKVTNKITSSEWQRYKKHLFSISKSENVEKVKAKLNEIYGAIKHQGGFEE